MVSMLQRLDSGTRTDVLFRNPGKNRSYSSFAVVFLVYYGSAFFARRMAAALRAARSLRASPVTR